MEFKDYYKTLALSRDATQDDVKRAYRKLARKYHPDVSEEPNCEERFKEVGEAYEVLKDPEKRAAYDQLGTQWQSGQDFRPPPNWNEGFEFSGAGFTGGDASAYSEFFESLFGREFATGGAGPRRSFQMRGEDHHAKILVDLDDTFEGATRAITLHAPELTAEGYVKTRERTLNVRIPKGIREGQQIRLAGQGGPALGDAPAGDLYLAVEFKPHRHFRADRSDLLLDLPVSPWEAALGANVKVPTPSGAVDLRIPASSYQGRKLRLKGRGIPSKQPGDLYVVLQVALPPAETAAAKELYRKMEKELRFDPRADLAV